MTKGGGGPSGVLYEYDDCDQGRAFRICEITAGEGTKGIQFDGEDDSNRGRGKTR